MNPHQQTGSGDAGFALARDEAEALLVADIVGQTVKCAVIGLGFIGTIVMRSIIEAGFEVHGYDRSAAAVDAFRLEAEGLAATRPWSATAEEAALAGADVVVVTVRAMVDADGRADLEPLASAGRSIARHPVARRLVVVESTLPPGATRSFAGELTAALGQRGEVFVAHCPERLQLGPSRWTLKNIPHLIGGVDASATRVAERFLGHLSERVVPVSAPEVSELSKLLENAFLSVGIGLVAEVTALAHRLGLSATEVTRAAATKPFGYHAFHPGPGIGGHCLPNDLRLLGRASIDAGLVAPLLRGAADVTNAMPADLVAYLQRLMDDRGLTLDGERVLIVGAGFKVGSIDTTATPAIDVVRRLRCTGAVPLLLDTRVPAFSVDGEPVLRISPASLIEQRLRIGVVLAGDPNVGGAALQAAVDILVDAGGGHVLHGGLPNAQLL